MVSAGDSTELQEPARLASDDPNVVVNWDQAHRYTPAPRHRRRILRRMIARLDGVEDVLDAGCGQPFLIDDVVKRLGKRGYGCDISDHVMTASRGTFAGEDFKAFDLAREAWPGGRQFDLVVCSEALEHILGWEAALRNVVAMARRYVIITVPCGKLRPVDELMGHHRHYRGLEVVAALRGEGCEPLLVRRWGFPVHTAYRVAVDRLGSDKVYESFAEGRPYTTVQKLASHVLYALFFPNDLFRSGEQLYVLARKR